MLQLQPEEVEMTQESPNLFHYSSKYDLVYSEIKRGEVYLCDFGEPYGSEQGSKKYAIVIQNDYANLLYPTTIVIVCTTEYKNNSIPVHILCKFSSSNMIDYDLARVGSEEHVIMAEYIRTVDKTRLRKYIGRLTPEFMKLIEGKIGISLNLSRDVRTIVKKKKVYVDGPAPKKTTVDPKAQKECKGVNMTQVQLLSFVDINELLRISRTYSTDEVKAQGILELFGFDFKKNGTQYLLKAIITSPKDAYFNLETLSESISQKESIDKEEIKRLIVARVKETFSFRKAPTIDFIRLVNSFLVKQEADHEKTTVKSAAETTDKVVDEALNSSRTESRDLAD